MVKASALPFSLRFFGTRHEYPQVPSQPKGITPSATFSPLARVMITRLVSCVPSALILHPSQRPLNLSCSFPVFPEPAVVGRAGRKSALDERNRPEASRLGQSNLIPVPTDEVVWILAFRFCLSPLYSQDTKKEASA